MRRIFIVAQNAGFAGHLIKQLKKDFPYPITEFTYLADSSKAKGLKKPSVFFHGECQKNSHYDAILEVLITTDYKELSEKDLKIKEKKCIKEKNL